MEEFWILIFVAFFVIKSLDNAETVQLEELEELPLQTFDELFVDEWLDKNEAEDLKLSAPTNFGQNVHHQIDRQNTQIGQIEPNSTDQLGQIEPNSIDQLGQTEPNSTDQLGQIEPNSTDQLGQIEHNSTDQLGQIEPNSTDELGQIEPNSTDQNPPLTESDHSGQIENNIDEDEQKRKIINKFLSIKDEFEQKGKYSVKERTQIEIKIAKHLKVSRTKIYKWKKEFDLSQKMHNIELKKNERKILIDKFDQRKAELKRAGLKNSHHNEINETVAKELGLSFVTIYNWKKELGQTAPNHKHSQSEQKELMKLYYELKDKTPKIRDVDIAKMLKIGSTTLVTWKKQFTRQQLHPNSVDGQSAEVNAAANVQEIDKSNAGII